MALGSVKHRRLRRALVPGQGPLGKFNAKYAHISVKIHRTASNRGGYVAEACPRAGKRDAHLIHGRDSVRRTDRCGIGLGKTPTNAYKNALKAMIRKVK